MTHTKQKIASVQVGVKTLRAGGISFKQVFLFQSLDCIHEIVFLVYCRASDCIHCTEVATKRFQSITHGSTLCSARAVSEWTGFNMRAKILGWKSTRRNASEMSSSAESFFDPIESQTFLLNTTVHKHFSNQKSLKNNFTPATSLIRTAANSNTVRGTLLVRLHVGAEDDLASI